MNPKDWSNEDEHHNKVCHIIILLSCLIDLVRSIGKVVTTCSLIVFELKIGVLVQRGAYPVCGVRFLTTWALLWCWKVMGHLKHCSTSSCMMWMLMH
jgi:hypothetical protein